MKSYQDINKNDIEAKSFNILIITATEMETKAFHEVMADPVMRVICGDYTYYVGQVGLYNIIHVQCLQMGSLNPVRFLSNSKYCFARMVTYQGCYDGGHLFRF